MLGSEGVRRSAGSDLLVLGARMCSIVTKPRRPRSARRAGAVPRCAGAHAAGPGQHPRRRKLPSGARSSALQRLGQSDNAQRCFWCPGMPFIQYYELRMHEVTNPTLCPGRPPSCGLTSCRRWTSWPRSCSRSLTSGARRRPWTSSMRVSRRAPSQSNIPGSSGHMRCTSTHASG